MVGVVCEDIMEDGLGLRCCMLVRGGRVSVLVSKGNSRARYLFT